MIIEENIKSVVIGLWRQGNTYETIATFTDLSIYEVDKIISQYQDKLKKNSIVDIYPLHLN